MENKNPEKKKHIILIVALNLLFVFVSIGSVFSKLASREEFLSLRYIIFQGLVICMMGVYAIGWQQIIKHMPLSTAYPNKAVTVAWGIVWGAVLFDEKITFFKVIGALIVIAGVVLFALPEEEVQEKEAQE